MIKVVAPKMLLAVIDRAIQAHGGGGVSQDFGLAYAWARARVMRIVGGPDEAHGRAIARAELIDERPDERLDTARREPYLREHLEGADGPLSIRQFGGGKANLTYLLRF